MKWDLEQAKLKPADVSFVRSALLSSVVAGSVEYGAPYLDKTGLVKRDFSASGPLAELDKWMVTALPYLEKEMLSAVKIDEDTFSFKCTEVRQHRKNEVISRHFAYPLLCEEPPHFLSLI